MFWDHRRLIESPETVMAWFALRKLRPTTASVTRTGAVGSRKVGQFHEDEVRMRREVAGSDQLIGRRRTVVVLPMPVYLNHYAMTTSRGILKLDFG
jgi:hypothetical protein